MDGKTQRTVIAASVAGLVAAAGWIASGHAAQAIEGEKIPCYGINKCQGTGDCGGKDHGCAGKNGCGGEGYISLEKETCLRIKDGRLTLEKA